MRKLRLPPRPHWLTTQNFLVGLALCAVTAVLIALFTAQQSRIDAQHDRIDGLLKQNGYVTEQYTKVYGQAEANGVKPTTTDPADLPKVGPTGPTGAAGARGITGKDGRSVATVACTADGLIVRFDDGTRTNAGDCVGADGAAGKPGKDGAAGKSGSDGAKGTDGGPGPTGATGAAGSNGIDGAPGAPGTPGSPGADGKDGAPGATGTGVASVSCVLTDSGTSFRFTLTDGTTQDVPGACIASPASNAG